MLYQVSNPFQLSTNGFKLTNAASACCHPQSKACRKVITVAKDALGFIIFSIIWEKKEEFYGVDLSSATTKEELLSLINDKSEKMIHEGGFGGCCGKNVTPKEVIQVAETATDYVISINTDINIIGHAAVVDGKNVDVETVLYCDLIPVCKTQYAIPVDEAAGDVTNGTDVVALGTYAAGDTILVNEDFEAAFTANGVVVNSVESNLSDDEMFHLVDVEAVGGYPDALTVNGDDGQECGCYKCFGDENGLYAYPTDAVLALRSSKSLGGEKVIKAKVADLKKALATKETK